MLDLATPWEVLSPDTGWHWANVIHTIGLPVGAVLVMMLFEFGLGTTNWRERFVKLGWDVCVLSIGAMGAVFSNPGLTRQFGTSTGSVQMSALLLILGLAGGILAIRRKTTPGAVPATAGGAAPAVPAAPVPSGKQAYLCLILGAMALVVPAYLTARY